MGGIGKSLELYLGVKVFRDNVIALERGLEEIEKFYRDAWKFEVKDTENILRRAFLDGAVAGGLTTILTGHVDLGAIIGGLAWLVRFFREYLRDSKKFMYAKLDKIEKNIIKGVYELLDIHREVSKTFDEFYAEKIDREIGILYLRFYRSTRRLYNFLEKVAWYFEALNKKSEKLEDSIKYFKEYLDKNLLRYHRTKMFLRKKKIQNYPINMPPIIATAGVTVV